jgi:hypothetical protein
MMPRRTLSTIAVLGLTAITLGATACGSAAKDDPPLAQLRSSLHDLFAPPRRAKRVRSKQAHAADREEARSAAGKAKRQDVEKSSRPAAVQEEPARAMKTREADDAAERPASVGRMVPEPRPRPREAPERSDRLAKATPSSAAASPHAKAHEERTAALPPPSRDATKEPQADEAATPAAPPPPSECQLRITADIAAVHILAPITAGQCAVEDIVRLDAVMVADGRRVAVNPPATLRCPMAESVIKWIRDDLTAAARELGAALKAVSVDSSFECRSRNRIAGAKLSEHGHANAIDVRGFSLTDGTAVGLTDAAVNRGMRERLRHGACARFTTVLGPGSDGYHENHIHLDLAERRGGYRMCQWDVRDPTVVASVPLPPERPASAPSRPAGGAKTAAPK